MKANTLFNAITRYFNNPSKALLENIKTVCNGNDPYTIMGYLETKLKDEDSTYMKQLRVLGWKSKVANILVKRIQEVLGKLIINYGFCEGLNGRHHMKTPNHVIELLNSTFVLLEENRMKIPNLLPPGAISQEVTNLYSSFPKCKDKDDKNCTQNIANFIVNYLQNTFNYGKQWSVIIGENSFYEGEIGRNTAKINVGGYNILVHYTNPVFVHPKIPADEVNRRFNKKTSWPTFWKTICPWPLIDRGIKVQSNALNEIAELCTNRSLCLVCKAPNAVLDNGNIDEAKFDPCVTDKELTVIMGEENGQEQQYPSNDMTNFDEGFRWVKNFENKTRQWRQKLKEFVKKNPFTTVIPSIREHPEIRGFAEEIVDVVDERLDDANKKLNEVKIREMNTSTLYITAEKLQASSGTGNSLLNFLLVIPVFLGIINL